MPVCLINDLDFTTKKTKESNQIEMKNKIKKRRKRRNPKKELIISKIIVKIK